jgi:hypothetical protein
LVIFKLKAQSSGASRDLAVRMQEQLRNSTNGCGVFTIDAVGRIEAIGHQTWETKLPSNLRLKENFARHFWPMQLMAKGVEQMAIDVLMRHQIGGLQHGSAHTVKTLISIQDRLRHAIDSIVDSLNLEIPRMMRAG